MLNIVVSTAHASKLSQKRIKMEHSDGKSIGQCANPTCGINLFKGDAIIPTKDGKMCCGKKCLLRYTNPVNLPKKIKHMNNSKNSVLFLGW